MEDVPTVIKEDNRSTIVTLGGKKAPSRVKHIGLRFAWMKEKIASQDLKVVYCCTQEQTAGIFTKALGANLFRKHRIGLNMTTSVHSEVQGL